MCPSERTRHRAHATNDHDLRHGAKDRLGAIESRDRVTRHERLATEPADDDALLMDRPGGHEMRPAVRANEVTAKRRRRTRRHEPRNRLAGAEGGTAEQSGYQQRDREETRDPERQDRRRTHAAHCTVKLKAAIDALRSTLRTADRGRKACAQVSASRADRCSSFGRLLGEARHAGSISRVDAITTRAGPAATRARCRSPRDGCRRARGWRRACRAADRRPADARSTRS